MEHPEWFTDAPEELDVGIAQRHFEDALILLQKTKDYINQFTTSNGTLDHVMSEIQRKVELIKKIILFFRKLSFNFFNFKN